ncbi:putative tankyrase-2 [Apostichopus japonicus]|uniref:Putative tankyrase-2 n=1 Tax=Stichopus japonicus TaxID=307972 RepID=A0A2G8JS14_STIJA|nr:putative tankyrase-2 [Apostichopus japonicus]
MPITPSLPLALANDFLECGKWLVEKGFGFKEHEQDVLVHRLLTEQIQSKQRLDVMRFLFEHGADLDQRYSGGNSPLHYAAGMTGPTDVLNLLVEYGADVDAINEDHCTPLFFATQANNFFGAGGLLLAGANVRHKNFQGLTAFDCILDYDEWLECGCFTDEIKARLKVLSPLLSPLQTFTKAVVVISFMTSETRLHNLFSFLPSSLQSETCQRFGTSHHPEGERIWAEGLFAKASSAHAMHTRGSSPQHPSLHLINTSSSHQNLRTAVHGAASSLSGRGSMLPPLQPKGFLTY